MKVTIWNVNGLRAALRKGLAGALEHLNPDVLMLQEVRAFPEQLPKGWAAPEGWHVLWHPAEKKGYAGTAIWSRKPIELIERGLSPDDADLEGRSLHVRIDGVRFSSLYLPSGGRGTRQHLKDAYLDRFAPWAARLAQSDEPILLGGDFNIAHTENDIHNPRGNKKSSGFLAHEREWFSALLDQGWTDTLRAHVGDQKGPYSWWSNMGRARELDRGWRIDYLLTNAALKGRVTGASIWREGGLTVSDHAPVSLELADPPASRS